MRVSNNFPLTLKERANTVPLGNFSPPSTLRATFPFSGRAIASDSVTPGFHGKTFSAIDSAPKVFPPARDSIADNFLGSNAKSIGNPIAATPFLSDLATDASGTTAFSPTYLKRTSDPLFGTNRFGSRQIVPRFNTNSDPSASASIAMGPLSPLAKVMTFVGDFGSSAFTQC